MTTVDGGREAIADRALATYKALKGALELVVAAILLATFALDRPLLPELAGDLRRHVARPWTLAAAELVVKNVTPRHVVLTIVALALDGALTSAEAWALRRGRPWGRWLVVAATSLFLPFEVEAWLHGHGWLQLLGLVFNLGVVVYLARRALVTRRAVV